MKRILLLLISILIVSSGLVSAQKKSPTLTFDQKMEWWRDAKFGMFVHWGPYATYGGVYHGYHQAYGDAAWIINRCKIPVREYKANATTFNPVRFNADSLVRLAKDAGAKYIVFTSKHHDGFAMFKSAASNFNIYDYTPFKRDVVAELAQACRKEGIKLGLYYSQCMDWTHPGGATARRPMNQGWPNPDSTEIDAFTAANNGAWDCIQESESFESYFYKVALPQIKELLTNYGDIAILWFDYPREITTAEAQDIQKELDKYPQIITNDRLKEPDFMGDYKTPEGFVPKLEDVEGIDWETCMCVGDSWGFRSWDTKWKTSEMLIHNLIHIAARGGNYLLNVGPDALGVVPEIPASRMREIGQWMKVYGEAIYGTRRSHLHPDWGDCIRKDVGKKTQLYLCVFNWPNDGKLVLDADYKIKGASLMPMGQKLKVGKSMHKIVIEVPQNAPDKIASVIRLDLNEMLPEDKIIPNRIRQLDKNAE